MRVIEASSFVAAPTAGLYLAQMGAEVIRVDQIGGGPDFRRWPLADNGASLYWEGLNQAKKSVAIDLGSPEGRELLIALITADAGKGGNFLTNFPASGFLAHDRVAQRSPGLITVRVMGRADGGPAVDYTVNCELGLPQITGLGPEPVNHVLPAWDLLTGAYAAFAMLAADRRRGETGAGGEVRVPLSDVGIGTLANLGMLAEVASRGEDRARYGNTVYGAFGRDFVTCDGARLMIMAITPRQWRALVEVLGLEEAIARIEGERGVSFDRDEGLRFTHRDALFPLVEAAVARRDVGELTNALDGVEGCWGLYRTMSDAIADPRLVGENPLFSSIRQVSGLEYFVPGALGTVVSARRDAPVRAPLLGEHTDAVLAEILKLDSGAIGALHDRGIVA
jgi:2-methylfumaryl-CoA isomerase